MSEEKTALLKNECLEVTASEHGAELHSARLRGHEYLWTGDPAIWRRHAPVLFPFVGRNQNNTYRLHGKEYPMACHGFCQDAHFEIIEHDETHVVFEKTDSEETRAGYPFRFSFRVTYTISDQTIMVRYDVENRSAETMYFGLGAHPGFLIPMEEGLSFEDYFAEFPDACSPDQVIFSENVLVSGARKPYPLEDGTRFPLHHDLFDFDAVVLENTGDTVCLRSDRGTRSAEVTFPQMPWVGLWHASKKEAPYVCIEPWVSLPGREGVIEEFSARRDLVHLPAGETYVNEWTITLHDDVM